MIGRGGTQKIKVITIPEPISPLPEPDTIFHNLPHVQLSNSHETPMNTTEKPDMGECPEMSNCPVLKLDKLTIGHLDKTGQTGVVQFFP